MPRPWRLAPPWIKRRRSGVERRLPCRLRRCSFVLRLRTAKGAAAMGPTITAFKSSPDRGRGLARDMRVRWALEEVGQPYDVRLVTFAEMKAPTHRALNPFGQIPTYEDGDLA